MANTKVSAKDTAPAIDRAADFLYLVDTSGGTGNKITPNSLLGLSGDPVGTTDSQTLTNKTLTSPTISGPTFSGTLTGTYTIGGTPTFPSAVATLTGSQTLTNKTLTSPTINTATIVNPTLTVNTISEHTSANGVTVDSLNIKDGKLNTNNSVVTANITDGAVTVAKRAFVGCRVYLSSGQTIADTTDTKITFDTEDFDIGSNFDASNNRFVAPLTGYYRVTLGALVDNVAAGTQVFGKIYVNTSADVLNRANAHATNDDPSVQTTAIVYLTSGQYIEGYVRHNSGGNETLNSDRTQTFLCIEHIGV